MALTHSGAAALAGADIARLVEFTEAAAYADLLRAAPPAWQCVEERSPDGWLLLAPRLDILLFNRLVGCGLDAPATRAGLQGVLERYRAAGLRNFGVQASPAAQPAELAEWLAAEGLAPRDRWTKVYRAAGPSPVPATDLRIERVGPRVRSCVPLVRDGNRRGLAGTAEFLVSQHDARRVRRGVPSSEFPADRLTAVHSRWIPTSTSTR